jgi:hypothetical protein
MEAVFGQPYARICTRIFKDLGQRRSQLRAARIFPSWIPGSQVIANSLLLVNNRC